MYYYRHHFDSNWTDKLTSYNGQTITYDANGILYNVKYTLTDDGTAYLSMQTAISSLAVIFLDTNMSAYCANNPVNNFDPTGQWIIKDAIKWI